MSLCRSPSSRPPAWLALAAAFFRVAYAAIISRGIRSCPMLKCSSDRCVCAPHSLALGTSTSPRLSVSLRKPVTHILLIALIVLSSQKLLFFASQPVLLSNYPLPCFDSFRLVGRNSITRNRVFLLPRRLGKKYPFCGSRNHALDAPTTVARRFHQRRRHTSTASERDPSLTSRSRVSCPRTARAAPTGNHVIPIHLELRAASRHSDIENPFASLSGRTLNGGNLCWQSQLVFFVVTAFPENPIANVRRTMRNCDALRFTPT